MSRERDQSASESRDDECEENIFGFGGGFQVVDAWEETAKNIKEEPADESSSRDARKRTSSGRSRSRERSHERNRDRPRDPRIRNRSPPPRRNRTPPRRNRTPPRKSFLEDLKKTFVQTGQDASFIDDFNQNPRGRGRNPRYANQQQQQPQQQYMNQPNMMMNNYAMMPNMAPMNYQYNPQIPLDMFGNPMLNPMLAPMMTMNIPQPVPAPMMPPGIMPEYNQEAPQIPQQNVAPPRKMQANNENVQQQQNNNMKKALDKGELNLTDILRQKSKQQSKVTSQSTITANKAKVKERCKKASDMILDLEKMKNIMPFTCKVTEVQTPQVKQVSTNKNKSPLLLSDHNAHFQFQTPPSRCRIALERNPLKLFQEQSKILMPLARNMKLDMLEVTLKAKLQIFPQVKKAVKTVQPVAPQILPALSVAPVNNIKNTGAVPKFLHKSCQANEKCPTCLQRENIEKNAKSTGTQTIGTETYDASTQSVEGDGGVTFRFDAEELRRMPFGELKLVREFAERFGFQLDADNEAVHQGDTREFNSWQGGRMNDDNLNNFTNPENPETASGFFSLSPVRSNRGTIFNRIGERVDSSSPYRVPSPTPYENFRNRSRSPLELNLSPSPRYQRRSRSSERNGSPRRNRLPFRGRNDPSNRPRLDDFRERRGRY